MTKKQSKERKREKKQCWPEFLTRPQTQASSSSRQRRGQQ
jgi:hypothetical protein